MEEIIKFFQTLHPKVLVPTNISNETGDFFLLLKETPEIYSKITEKNISIQVSAPELSIKYKNTKLETLFLLLTINEEFSYEIPFVLNHKESLKSLIRFFGAETFNLILGDEKSLGLAGPFSKAIFPSREEWLILDEINDDFYTELHFILSTAFNPKKLIEIVELQEQGLLQDEIDLDEISK